VSGILQAKILINNGRNGQKRMKRAMKIADILMMIVLPALLAVLFGTFCGAKAESRR
jgi:hypothetical protein